MAGVRGGRGFTLPLLITNSVVYLIILGLVSWSLNKYLNGEQNHPRNISLCLSVSLSPSPADC